jgi:UDP-N-acetylglucosamine 2-epimerase (hydrolysing)
MKHYAKDFVDSLLQDTHNYVLFPNNDLGSSCIIKDISVLQNNLLLFSLSTFEYFLTLLKARIHHIGIAVQEFREAPYYGIQLSMLNAATE